MNRDEDVKINIIFKKDKGNLLANATVSINSVEFGYVTMKGFQIWRSRIFNERLQENINILPPTITPYGRPYTLIFFENPKKWQVLEEKIYSAFNQTRNKTKALSEDVDVDEIDNGLSSY